MVQLAAAESKLSWQEQLQGKARVVARGQLRKAGCAAQEWIGVPGKGSCAVHWYLCPTWQ